MLRGHHKNQLIGVHHYRHQFWILRIIRKHSKFAFVPQNVVRNLAAQRPLNHNANHRMQPLKIRQHPQKVERSKFIRADDEFPGLQLPQFYQRLFRIFPQVDKPLGVLLQDPTSVSKLPVAGRSVEQRLANLSLQFPDCLADRRLSTIKFVRRPREPAFPRYRQKHFQSAKCPL